MLLVDVPAEARTDLASEATRRGYVLEATDADRWFTGAGPDPLPHVVMLARGSASRVPQAEHARWLPMAELEDPITNGGGAAALFDRADRLLLATTWLRPTILVVDDDPSILDIARYALGNELRVVTLDSPVHLFETLEREQPVVLVFEARLPSFDAIAFTRMIRGLPAYRELPILVLGANLDSGTRLAAYDAGVDDLLMKPLIPLELRARVGQRLERLRVERLTRGVHAMTAIALPARALESVEAHRALTAAGRRATAALVRPRAPTTDAAPAVAWLRESRRVVHAIGATARFACYRDDLALLLVLDAPPVLATRVLDSLQLNKPGEAPDWDVALDGGRGPEALLGR
jgi:DNA-binding response OmpR family regulator